VHFKLVCRPSADDVYDIPENAGYDHKGVVDALEARITRGDSFEVSDTVNMTDDERDSIYIEEAIAAAGNRYRTARVFGSNKHPGEDFGWRVPALLVYANQGDRSPADVYPHEFKDGRMETIAGFLASL
jgi:hypothetical protein